MKCEPGQCVTIDTSCGYECVVCGWGWITSGLSPREKIVLEHGNETFSVDPKTGAMVSTSFVVERTELPPSDPTAD